jgi:hypothetical protein
MMQSVEERQDIRNEDAAVMQVVGLKKRRRVQNLTAYSRQKRKDGIRRIHGSRRNSDAACRKNVSLHATVAWRKRKLLG